MICSRHIIATSFTALVAFLLSANPAKACMFHIDLPYSPEIEKMIEEENRKRPDVDAVVWGVFVESESTTADQIQKLDFVVGGHLKGEVKDRIKVKTNRTQDLAFHEVYYLHLMKTADEDWLEVDAPQNEFAWDKEACEIEPNGIRCEIYKLKVSENEKHCLAYLHEVRDGCYLFKTLPEVCQSAVDVFFQER